MAMPVFNFGDVRRHTRIIGMLFSRYIQKYEDEFLYKTHEPVKDNNSLVYKGDKYSSPYTTRLFSATEFAKYPNKSLKHIEPDFMLFRDNPFLMNKKETQTLGQPDLVVEIWSESNDIDERNFKRHLYSTSPVTEHWYFSQKSNTVKCFLGDKQINSQSLENILVTQKGIEFDLRILAL